MNNIREKIIEFIGANQEQIMSEISEIRKTKDYYIAQENPAFKTDLEDQYEARIRQLLSFAICNNTNLPIENVIIEIEKMDMEGFLKCIE